MGLNDCRDLKKPVILFTDSETMLELIDAWMAKAPPNAYTTLTTVIFCVKSCPFCTIESSSDTLPFW